MKFKRFAIGLAIFILTILFIVFVNRAFNPKPSSNCQYSYPSYPSTYSNGGMSKPISVDNSAYNTCIQKYENDLAKQKQTSFFIIVGMSVMAIIAGVLVMSVGPVSWGLILAGLAMILYILIANFDEVGKPWRAVISGAALIILIWLAYAKLGDKEQMFEQNPSSPVNTPPSPNPQNYSSPNPPTNFDDDGSIH